MEEAKQVIKLENQDIVAIVEVKPKYYRYLPTVDRAQYRKIIICMNKIWKRIQVEG